MFRSAAGVAAVIHSEIINTDWSVCTPVCVEINSQSVTSTQRKRKEENESDKQGMEDI